MTKRDMMQYRQLKINKRIKRELYEEAEREKFKMEILYSEMPKAKNGDDPDDKLINIIEKAEQKRRQYLEAYAKASQREAEIAMWIESHRNEFYRNVLLLKYIKGYPSWKVGNILKCSRETVERTVKNIFDLS